MSDKPPDKPPVVTDALGLAPYGKAIEKVVDYAGDGAKAFLSRICLPAAEEFGFLIQDKVKNWRIKNLTAVMQKAEAKLKDANADQDAHANPRIVCHIMNYASLIDVDDVQELWAGLIASSCDASGNDDSNLIFINILAQLTTAEARILQRACEGAQKRLSSGGLLVTATQLIVPTEELTKFAEITDIYRLDRELDHMRSLELIINGFLVDVPITHVDITPTPLALHLYARAKGAKAVSEFYGLQQ